MLPRISDSISHRMCLYVSSGGSRNPQSQPSGLSSPDDQSQLAYWAKLTAKALDVLEFVLPFGRRPGLTEGLFGLGPVALKIK